MDLTIIYKVNSSLSFKLPGASNNYFVVLFFKTIIARGEDLEMKAVAEEEVILKIINANIRNQ